MSFIKISSYACSQYVNIGIWDHGYPDSPVMKAETYFIHPKFDDKSFVNDIALIYLASDIFPNGE